MILARVLLPGLVLATVPGLVQSAAAAGRPALAGGGPLPLTFEPNRGQADPAVRFLARGRGYGLFLTPTETVLVLTPPRSTTSAGIRPAPPALPSAQLAVVRRELEYDFVVAPGADPGAIALAFEGAEHVRLDEGGDLVLATAAGEVRFRRPVIYQDAEGARRPIDGGYVLEDGRVRFRVAAWDASRPLVIDPVLGYSTFLGGGGDEAGTAIAVDVGGNAFVTGTTNSSDFPVQGPFQAMLRGGNDAFVVKLDPAGSALIYATYLGSTTEDVGNGIAIGGRVFTVVLSSPTGGATLGAASVATVSITDNDAGGVVQFSPSTFSASECAALPCEAVLTVVRNDGGASNVSVDFATVDGTASALSDYVATTGTVHFGADERVQRIRIPLQIEPGAQPARRFSVILSNPRGGASLGLGTVATVTITDTR